MTGNLQYDYQMPQPRDIPAENQTSFLSNFQIINDRFSDNHVPLASRITNISNANPGVITSPGHYLKTGNSVTLHGLNDDPELQPAVTGMGALNNTGVTVTVIDANTFSIGVNTTNTTTYVPYIADAVSYFSPASISYDGWHKQLFFPENVSAPNLTAPACALYPTGNELEFQNSDTLASIAELTGVTLTYNHLGVGFTTPWGLIINMGETLFSETPATITFPVPYTTAVYSVQCQAQSANIMPVVTNLTLVSFGGYQQSNPNNVCYWWAIGK